MTTMEWNGMEWNGMEWKRMFLLLLEPLELSNWNGMEWNGNEVFSNM